MTNDEYWAELCQKYPDSRGTRIALYEAFLDETSLPVCSRR